MTLGKSPIKRSSVVATIIDIVEQALRNKELKPGDTFPSESQLVSQLNVSKSSVREAVKMLEAIGVVEVKQGEGTFIRKEPSADTINPLLFSLLIQQGTDKDILDLRDMFEPSYTIMAMNRATTEDLIRIQETITILERNIATGAVTEDDDLNFHRAILQATYNPYVIRIGNTIIDLFATSVHVALSHIPFTSLEDHKRIFSAFKAKNEEDLRKAITKSFEGWKSYF